MWLFLQIIKVNMALALITGQRSMFSAVARLGSHSAPFSLDLPPIDGCAASGVYLPRTRGFVLMAIDQPIVRH